MNVLVLGSGGREHALSWKIAQSPKVDQLYVAPGNSGTREIATNLSFGVNDFETIAEEVRKRDIELIVVGPEDPLVRGIHDFILAQPGLSNVSVIGPMKAAAQLEGSKDFAKEFMNRHNIPTAAHKSFTSGDLEDAYRFLDSMKAP